MRFFAHDGKTTHGPAGIDELLRLPGFDGDTLICPVGSNDTADWKPAIAYPPFKKAMLESVAAAPPAPPPPAPPPLAPASPLFTPIDSPRSMLAPLDAPSSPFAPLPPPPTPIVKTVPCPSCKHANLLDARFCNGCAARMDGTVEAPKVVEPPKAPVPIDSPQANQNPFDMPSAPPPFPLPIDTPSAPPPFPLPIDTPKAPAPFELSTTPSPFPKAVEPAPSPRPLQPGKMGQLSSFEEPVEAAASAPSLAPEPEPAAAVVPMWKRPLVLAAFAGAAVVASAAGYMMLKKPALPVETVAELAPSAPAPVPEPAPTPVVYTPPPVTASPLMPAPRQPAARIPQQAAVKPKRVRKTRPSRAPKAAAVPPLESPGAGDTLIESTAPDQTAKPKPKSASKKGAAPVEQDPLLEAMLSESTEPGAGAAAEAAPAAAAKKAVPTIGQRAAAKPSAFSLPGLSRPVSASDRALSQPAPAAPPSEPADSSLAPPGKAAPPPGIEDLPAKSAEGDSLALMQVHEQFDFCAQLLTQAAFGDHYDTCLCKEAREAAPYRGRRGFYVAAKKKESGSGHLETTAKILTSKLDGTTASVTARWKASGSDKGRTSSQTWKLEDGLWCQAP